jgi:hypothetical protein
MLTKLLTKLLTILLAIQLTAMAKAQPAGVPWVRHTIDSGSQGADGVRTADINSDGLMDLTTGWEEGGEVRVYFNPGPAQARTPWPMAVVGRAPSVEDAVFADLDGDGSLEIVASCEGTQRKVIAFKASDDALAPKGWQGADFNATALQQQWMFALPLQVDGAEGIDLILGSKGANASISWLQAPAAPSQSESWQTWSERWKLNRISDAGWIMSLRNRDIDSDGDQDIVFSDRRGMQSGVWWLENLQGVTPAANSQRQLTHWNRQVIAGLGQEVMFMDMADLNGDGLEDAVSAVSGDDIIVAFRKPSPGVYWQQATIAMPSGVGTGKAVAVTDVDQDGQADIVVTCENARNTSGVFWLSRTPMGDWQAQDISGPAEGIKFDRIELLDLDADGDWDVVTCEERDNLGVIWYENPTQQSKRGEAF